MILDALQLFRASTSHKLSTTRMEASDPTATLFAPREPEIEDEVLWAIYRQLVSQRVEVLLSNL